jgi:hypothetical protein
MNKPLRNLGGSSEDCLTKKDRLIGGNKQPLARQTQKKRPKLRRLLPLTNLRNLVSPDLTIIFWYNLGDVSVKVS